MLEHTKRTKIIFILPDDRYLQEYTALGTAGGMYHFRDQILSGNPEFFFVMNCDVCGDFPLEEMLEFHRSRVQNGSHFTVLATEVGFLLGYRTLAYLDSIFILLVQRTNSLKNKEAKDL